MLFHLESLSLIVNEIICIFLDTFGKIFARFLQPLMSCDHHTKFLINDAQCKMFQVVLDSMRKNCVESSEKSLLVIFVCCYFSLSNMYRLLT